MIRANVPEGTEIFALASYPQSLAFYMKQTLTLLEPARIIYTSPRRAAVMKP